MGERNKRLRIVQLTDDKTYWFAVVDEYGVTYDMEIQPSLAENGNVIVLQPKPDQKKVGP